MSYYKLISSIPKEWLRQLKAQTLEIKQEPAFFTVVKAKDQNNICKYITDFQIKNKSNSTEKTKAQRKWESYFQDVTFDWKSIFSNIFAICKENKLQNF